MSKGRLRKKVPLTGTDKHLTAVVASSGDKERAAQPS